MRLMIIGKLGGHLSTAGKIALEKGIKAETLDTVDQALVNLRTGKGADLILIDLSQDLGRFTSSLKIERIHVPVVACGPEGTPAKKAEKAIEDGAQEFITLPPDPDLIASL
ncbi:MAG: sigma-54-dependent Fis family transcriptional regulator, partial [Pseudomonadota bacterium]